MARKIKFFAVDSMPTTWVADAVYIVEDGDYAEGWVTDKMGVPKELGNSIMINELIAAAMSSEASDTLVGVAGEILGGGKLVYLLGEKFHLYDANNPNLANLAFGITKNAAIVDATVNVQFSGIFTEAGLGLTPEVQYYAGLNGLLTITPEIYTVSTLIGIAKDADSIKLDIQQSIITI